jgi:hypothetical protein
VVSERFSMRDLVSCLIENVPQRTARERTGQDGRL